MFPFLLLAVVISSAVCTREFHLHNTRAHQRQYFRAESNLDCSRAEKRQYSRAEPTYCTFSAGTGIFFRAEWPDNIFRAENQAEFRLKMQQANCPSTKDTLFVDESFLKPLLSTKSTHFVDESFRRPLPSIKDTLFVDETTSADKIP